MFLQSFTQLNNNHKHNHQHLLNPLFPAIQFYHSNYIEESQERQISTKVLEVKELNDLDQLQGHTNLWVQSSKFSWHKPLHLLLSFQRTDGWRSRPHFMQSLHNSAPIPFLSQIVWEQVVGFILAEQPSPGGPLRTCPGSQRR